MDNTQLLVSLIAPLGTLAVVLVGFLYNNSRLSDFSGRLGDLNGRFNDINQRFGELKDFVRSEVARIDEKIRVEMSKNHSEMLHRFADLDTRIIRIEHHLGLKG